MELQLKRPAWIEIDLSALENNYNFIRSRINACTKIAAVVKAKVEVLATAPGILATE